MNTVDAVQVAALNYPGGITAVAARMGKSPAVLAHKLNPNNTTHQLSLVEFEQILALTHDHTPLHALASQLGYRLELVEKVADSQFDAFDAMVMLCREQAAVVTSASEALHDGKITVLELKAIRHQSAELMAAITQLDASMAAMQARCHG